MGSCYTNSEKIRQVCEQLGIKSYYFSGWVFRQGDMPKHHAWVVVIHEGKMSIIDSLKEHLFLKAIESLNITTKDVNWRKNVALSIKTALKELPLNTQQIIIGQVIDGFFYVGSPDTYENSKKIFQKLTIDFPNHPAYSRDGDNMEGRSKLQEELARLGIK